MIFKCNTYNHDILTSIKKSNDRRMNSFFENLEIIQSYEDLNCFECHFKLEVLENIKSFEYLETLESFELSGKIFP